MGGTGADSIFGNFADNILTGNGGSDLLFGYGGDDTLSGGDGDDRMVDPFGSDTLHGGSGNDIGAAFSGDNALYGGTEDDILTGGIGADTLYGEAGNDVLVGDISITFFGNDLLTGGAGDDLLSGGGGADLFVFRPADGNDTIGTLSVNYVTPANSTVIGADFQPGLDTVILAGFAYATAEEAFGHVTDQSGTATFSDQGTTIIFYGLSTADLSAADFAPVLTADDAILV